MNNQEVIKMLQNEKAMICHDCMHPMALGWCENKCKLPQAFDMAIEALEQARKYKWHDLRKNPDDLPTENGKEYLCIKKDFQYDFFEFNTEYNCFGYMASMIHDELDSCPTESWFESTDDEVIAWKYIERLEEEEE